MDPVDFFRNPNNTLHLQYEALRSFYVDKKTAREVAKLFGLQEPYFKKLRYLFQKNINAKSNPFFEEIKKGPKKRFTEDNSINMIISLRKKNHSVPDIQSILDSKGIKIALDTIDKILKAEGFASLPRRTHMERKKLELPPKIMPPETMPLKIIDEEFCVEKGAGVLLFLPLLQQKGIIKAIKRVGFPGTSVINDVSSILSFLALKLFGRVRYSQDEHWKFNRALGLFSMLNVLPKNATLSSYSYRTNREMNKKFLQELLPLFQNDQSEFNLDFKAIPHWGDESVLEKNWSGTRRKAMKSILALIVQAPSSGYVTYTDAEIKHDNESDAILEFVDFWTKTSGTCPNMLIFDSKLTSYENLNKLNQSEEKIKFLTLRRRGAKLIERVSKIPEDDWSRIKIEGKNRKHKLVKIYDETCKLRKYKGEVRQIIITGHGRERPTFLITNDFELKASKLVKKYARRWLVELEIAEHIDFFQLNNPSSSIVVKVDFDLALSLLAHNLYKDLAKELPGFENCTASTIHHSFIDNGARIRIKNRTITVELKKKTHLPLLFNIPWIREETTLDWHGTKIQFKSHAVS